MRGNNIKNIPTEILNKTQICITCNKEKIYKDFGVNPYIKNNGDVTYSVLKECTSCRYKKKKDKPKQIREYKNNYKLFDDYAIIYLEKSNGEIFETYIDLEDFEKVINFEYKWKADYQKNIDSYYAVATIYSLETINGRRKSTSVFLHKFVMNEKENIVDHIEHNTLDNRKKNLRVTTNDLNTKNRKSKNSNNKSGYRNVCWLKSYGQWCVQLSIEGKNTRLGFFDDVDEAGKYSEEMRQKYYGEYAGKS